MKKIISLIVAISLVATAAWLTPKLMADPGVLVLRLGGYQIEMRALVALALILAGIVLFWLLVWLIRAPGRAARGLAHRRGRSLFGKGLLALSEGRWKQAEKWLAASARTSPTPELSYMAAARAAIAQNQPQKAEDYLDQAEQHIDNPLTIDLTRAELWLKSGKTDQATNLLQRILKSYPNNPRALSLLLQAAQASGQWQTISQHLPRARRLGLLPENQAAQLARHSLHSALQQAPDQYALLKTWSQASKADKTSPDTLTTFAHAATRHGQHKEAITALEKHLKKHWPQNPTDDNHRVLATWAEIATSHTPEHAIAQAQKWLGKHPDNPLLYKTLGLAWARQGDDNQARENLEKAAQLGHDPDVLRALARWHETHGNPQTALDYLKRATDTTTSLVVQESR